MTDQAIKDRRLAPRRDIPIQAVVVGDRQRRQLITRDVGPYGAFFVGTYPARKGARLHMRLDIAVEEDHVPSIMNLDVYVVVTRVESTNGEGVSGFGAQWVRASSVGDVIPLKEFLHTYLEITGGFVNVLKPESDGEVPIYSFTFPKPGQVHAPVSNPVPKTEQPRAEQHPQPTPVEKPSEPTPPPEPAPKDKDTDKEDKSKSMPTRVYASLPVKYSYAGKTFEGTAVKLKVEGLRIDTTTDMPEVYSPVEIEIPVSTPGKEGILKLNGTISLVRKSKRGKGGQFEVKFSLKNSPVTLEGYRGILRTLQESIVQS